MSHTEHAESAEKTTFFVLRGEKTEMEYSAFSESSSDPERGPLGSDVEGERA
jgi:hypothetical protein